MVVLRRTQKLAVPLPLIVESEARSDTALGDWYVNRVVVDRRPLLLLISAYALLPIVLPARDVAGLPDRLPDVVAARLRRLSIPPELIQAEIAAMKPVITAPASDRSVLGILVDFAKALPFYLDRGNWDETTLPFVETKLGETPCHAGRPFAEVVFPNRDAPALIAARWRAGSREGRPES